MEAYLTLNSAQRSVTSHVTAQRLVDMVVVDSNNKVVDMEVEVDSEVDVKEDKPATLAVVMDICLVSHLQPFFPIPLLKPSLTTPR